MKEEIVELTEDVSNSPLWSEDAAPVPANKRTWNQWHLASIWVGMAVCVPTYMMAALMISEGFNWIVALVIIGLANLIITIPMVLNGHAGVKYGIPFPVLGRSSFGTVGIHLPALVRALVACGWFGIQTWLGGMAIYAIYCAIVGIPFTDDLNTAKFICFGIFWLINIFFIIKGTESIKWLEIYAAPILIIMGIVLIGWGASQAGGFGIVLKQSTQLNKSHSITNFGNTYFLEIDPIVNADGSVKADAYQISYPDLSGNISTSEWLPVEERIQPYKLDPLVVAVDSVLSAGFPLTIQLKSTKNEKEYFSKKADVVYTVAPVKPKPKIWSYIIWLTGMVGFWATMSISIADITRYTDSQKSQVKGQFIGLPGTMILYSFVGIFVTCAAVINFKDVLISSDAPWDPIDLLARFESPVVIIVAQIFMLIATLSTNIAANVIAPANAISNVNPKAINFTKGGLIAALVGIALCPWLLMNNLFPILIFVSGLLGPVLGIMLCDYFTLRKKNLNLNELFKPDGIYSYSGGFNWNAMIALALGIGSVLLGYFVSELSFLYSMSWFTGFFVSYIAYYFLMKNHSSIKQTI